MLDSCSSGLTSIANLSTQRWSNGVSDNSLQIGSTSAWRSAPATYRTAFLQRMRRRCFWNSGIFGMHATALYSRSGWITVKKNYRKRGSASYIVREVRSVRERERERERDGSDVTIDALKLALRFALFLAKNVHRSIDEEFCTFPCQNLHLSVSPLECR